MEGKIISYNPNTRTGSIQGSDGGRYIFSANDYRSQTEISIGQMVDFDFDFNNSRMTSVCALQGSDGHAPTFIQGNDGNPTTFQGASNSPYQPTQISSQQVIEKGKVAVADTLTAFQSIQADPANGLQSALMNLGDDRALNAGIVLCLLFVLAGWAALVKILSLIIGIFSGFGRIFSGGSIDSYNAIGTSEHIKILILSAVPAIGIVLILWAIQQFFKGAGNYKQYIFATGVCLFPITLLLFVLWVFGFNSGDLILLLTIFCFSTLVLLLNSTLTGILQLSSRKSLFLVPIVLVVDTFIIRTIASILS
jgi:hypothetical protein